MDKNAEAVSWVMARCGFGFVEVATVTPLATAVGNPQPRLFRLPEHQALINRMGFNNEGMQAESQARDMLARVRSSNKLYAVRCWG